MSAIRVHITPEPLSLERLNRAVESPGAGAIVIFQGVTREVSQLDYEAYHRMAEERLEQIMRDCVESHNLQGAAVEHRTGAVRLGEPSVIVAVSAAHRDGAFAAAREAIDRIKAEVPIWKRERLSDGQSHWVKGCAPPESSGGAA